MSKSNLPGPITRSKSHQLATNQAQNQNFPENTQASGSILNRSIQSTKNYVKALFPSKTNTTITEKSENNTSKIDKSQISAPINTTFTTSLNNSEFQEQNSNIFSTNNSFKTSLPTNKNNNSLLDTPTIDETEAIIPQQIYNTDPIYENTRLYTQEIAIRTDIYNIAEQNLANLNHLINFNFDNFNQQNNDNMAQQNSSLEIKMALEEVQNFDGKTPDVFTWIKQIEKASDSLRPESRPTLLNLLRHRVRGNASDSMKGINFDSIQEFIHHIERLFGKKVDHLELSYKIGTIYQIPNESVLSYQLRLENLLDRTRKAY